MELYRLIFPVLLISSNTIAAVPPRAVTDIIDANVKFTGDLHYILTRTEGNALYSPISLHTILSLLQQGAAGKTLDGFKEVLHLSDNTAVPEAYQNIIESLNSVEKATLDIANKIFVNQIFKLKDEFSLVAKNHFLSEVENVNFANRDATAKHINDWVSARTHEKITSIISPDSLDDTTRIVLVNAIYFKSDWRYKFDENLTANGKFYSSENESMDCKMMQKKQTFLYGYDKSLDARILKLPYTNKNLSLTIILPNSAAGAKTLHRKLKTTSFSKLFTKLYLADVMLSLPKFKLETTIDLVSPLVELGLGDIFLNTANFTNLSDQPIYVDDVVQKVYIKVNEGGSEAAGVTGTIMHKSTVKVELPRIIFTADQPFVFALTYTQGAAVLPLFVGRLTKP